METNIDLKAIWNKQPVETPNIEILFEKVNRAKRKNLTQLIIVNISLLLTIGFVGFIWYYFQPEYITTKIGIVLAILSMVIFLFPYNKQLAVLTQKNTEPNSKEYLKQLKKLKEMQVFQQTKVLNIYFILLSLGIGLYFYEYVTHMSMMWGILTYGLTAAWFAICWFVIRPKTIAKQNKKLNNLLEEFERLNSQMDE